MTHPDRIRQELKDLGVSKLALSTMESHYLPKVIHDDEPIGGVVYGFHADGFVMLVATDRRIIFLDRKPLFTNEDEVNYRVVSGVNLSHAGLGTTVVLHTRIKDYSLVTFNKKCAEGFVDFIEARSVEQSDEEEK